MQKWMQKKLNMTEISSLYRENRGSLRRKAVVHLSLSFALLLVVYQSLRPLEFFTYFDTAGSGSSEVASFLAGDLDSSERVPCGAYKCFYRSRSNETLGYLIMREKLHEFTTSDAMVMVASGWNLANELKRQYEVDHFLLEPPFNITVTRRLATDLNDHLWSEEQVRYNYTNRILYPTGSTAIVQKCRVAPDPFLLIASGEGKLVEFEQRVEGFLEYVLDRATFVENFQAGMDTIKTMLETEPCLMYDFQTMLDMDGHIYNLDVDRCFDRHNVSRKVIVSQEKATKCLDALEHIQQRIHDVLFENGKPKTLLDDLDTSQRVPCGTYKCFFRSKSNATVGYLVSRSAAHFVRERLIMLESGYDLAKSLKRRYDINNFLLEPPIDVTVSTKEVAERMNQNLWSELKDEYLNQTFFPEKKQVFVQKCKVAPEPNLLIGCDDYKSTNYVNYLEEFMLQVSDKASFVDTLKENLSKTRDLLQEESCLFYDFQVLMDTQGKVYHFDFDRCYHSSDGMKKRSIKLEDEKTLKCLETLNEIEKEIVNRIQGNGTALAL